MMYFLLFWLWYMPAGPGQRGKWGNILAFAELLSESILLLCLFASRKPTRLGMDTSLSGTSQSTVVRGGQGYFWKGSTTLPVVSVEGCNQHEREEKGSNDDRFSSRSANHILLLATHLQWRLRKQDRDGAAAQGVSVLTLPEIPGFVRFWGEDTDLPCTGTEPLEGGKEAATAAFSWG